MKKNILICFDGTSNDPSDANEENSKSEDNSISNVLKLHLLAGGDLENRAGPLQGQESYYYSGVGTRGRTRIRRLLSAGLAIREPKLIRKAAKTDLAKNYKPGDRIFIFGFSRGAAIARMFASELATRGFKQKGAGVVGAITPRVHFLGAWDTVASLGVPNLDDDTEPSGTEIFEDNSIAFNIRTAVHLVSIDDQRLAFRPTLMNHESRVEELWFPGGHSDIGGGYRRDGLSDVTLRLMLNRAKANGANFRSPSSIDYENLGGGDADIEADEVEVEPDVNGKLHADAQNRRPQRVKDRTLKARRVYVLKNNVAVSSPRPILHHSVLERLNRTSSYRPSNLQTGSFEVLNKNGSKGTFSGWS